MNSLILYGSTTSPFVRRVRVVCYELQQPYTLIDTLQEQHQQEMRQLSPLWKVPVADFGQGLVVFDSRAIIDCLIEHIHQGEAPTLRLIVREPASAHFHESNLIQVIDGALDAAIHLFYMRREGVDTESVPYLVKQKARITSTLNWLEGQLVGTFLTPAPHFGLSELFLYCALEWMQFRDAYPIQNHPRLINFLSAHAARDSLKATIPHL